MRRSRPHRSRLTKPAQRATRSRRTKVAASSRPEHRGRVAAGAPPTAPAAGDQRGTRAARTRQAARSSLRRTTLTGRAAVLGIVVCMLVLTLAYPLRSFLSQRSQIRDVAAQNAQDRAQVAALQQAVDRYKDPRYVQQLARTRLHFQMPGDKVYILPPVAPTAPVHQREGHTNVQVAPEKAWYDQLWGSAVQSGK